MIKQIIKFIPIKSWTIEYNKFAFMQLEEGLVQGVDYQNGKLKNYASVKDYIFAMQEGRCALCGKPIDKNNYHCHHLWPQSMITTNTLKFINSVVITVHVYTHKLKELISIKGKSLPRTVKLVLSKRELHLVSGEKI